MENKFPKNVSQLNINGKIISFPKNDKIEINSDGNITIIHSELNISKSQKVSKKIKRIETGENIYTHSGISPIKHRDLIISNPDLQSFSGFGKEPIEKEKIKAKTLKAKQNKVVNSAIFAFAQMYLENENPKIYFLTGLNGFVYSAFDYDHYIFCMIKSETNGEYLLRMAIDKNNKKEIFPNEGFGNENSLPFFTRKPKSYKINNSK